jgi:hypothetical protein
MSSGAARWLLPALAGAALALGLALLPLGAPPPLPAGAPRVARPSGYVGSGACRKCHPAEHASFRESFHSSMTRRPNELRWNGSDGPTLPARLELDGRTFELEEDPRGRIIVRGPDLHASAGHLHRLGVVAREPGVSRERLAEHWSATFAELPTVERELAQVTGSHSYLAFWVSSGQGAELRQLPFVYQLAAGNFDRTGWSPWREVFLQPPEELPHIARWNGSCIQCHAVAGQPRQTELLDQDTGALDELYDTTVSELGIACEACHGPGAKHAHRLRDPFAREAARRLLDGPAVAPDALDIVSPGRLDAERSSAVCGQCHAYFVPTDAERWWTSGFVATFSPGQDRTALERSRALLLPDAEQLRASGVSRDVGSIFWSDGTIRVGGREYSALVASACYAEGSGERQLSCGSCHSLHSGERSDQLRPEVEQEPSASCRSCHGATPEHSGHPLGAPGSDCVDCHMPRRTYALLKTIRDHRIQSPTLALDDPPSACGLCHVDRSEEWLRAELLRLFPGLGAPEAAEESDALPWAVRRALSGNAAVRAVLADALGRPEALALGGPGLARAVLAELTSDPYAAVRRVAARALHSVPEAPPGPLERAELARLHAARDSTPIVISE